MRRCLLHILFFNLIIVPVLTAQDDVSDYLKNESAPGARAAMGVFAAGYGKALAEELFDFKLFSWQNRLTSIGIAAVSYQIISFDSQDGLQFKPFKFNKEWKGYWEGYAIGEGLDLFLWFASRYEAAQFIIGSTVVITMGIIITKGERSGGFRVANDGPLTIANLFNNRYSYWVHFAGSGGLYWAFSNHSASKEMSLLYTTGFIWLWEVKDGYLKWEDYGWIGGDGFSWRDGVAGTVAAVGSYAFDKWFLPFLKTNIFKRRMDYNSNIHFMIYPDSFQRRVLVDVKLNF